MHKFFEVFKTLKLPEDLAVYFENVEVTKVSKTSTNSLARGRCIKETDFPHIQYGCQNCRQVCAF